MYMMYTIIMYSRVRALKQAKKASTPPPLT